MRNRPGRDRIFCACTAARAQTYPNQPVRFSTTMPQGGVDVTLRVLAQTLTETGWPQVIVENRPSAAGTLASIATKQAKPDRHTLLLADLTSHAVSVSMVPDLQYDPIKDFAPITLLWTFPSILAVPADHPASSVKELVDFAVKSRVAGYASQGRGRWAHSGRDAAEGDGAPMTHVPIGVRRLPSSTLSPGASTSFLRATRRSGRTSIPASSRCLRSRRGSDSRSCRICRP